MARFYLTTAIDYANGDPHLGHALEKIGADAICRFRRQLGDDVWFLIGMDEHGQKVAQTAEAAGLAPQEFVDRVAARFEAMWATLGLSHDQFIRTSHPTHHAAVQELLERIFAKSPDDFYERSYTGLYCVGCESFKQPADIVDGKCLLHPTRTLQEITERNWFFRLSAYTERLKALFDRWVSKIIKPVHLDRLFKKRDVRFCFLDHRGVLRGQHIENHEGGQQTDDDNDHHQLDEREAGFVAFIRATLHGGPHIKAIELS